MEYQFNPETIGFNVETYNLIAQLIHDKEHAEADKAYFNYVHRPYLKYIERPYYGYVSEPS